MPIYSRYRMRTNNIKQETRKLLRHNETVETDTYIGLGGVKRSRMTRDHVTCQA